MRRDEGVQHLAMRELHQMSEGVLDRTADAAAEAGASKEQGAQPSKLRAVVRTILQGAAGLFVFGFIDNFMLYMAGAGIDKAIAAAGFSAAAVAGLGNAVSDAIGQAGADKVEGLLDRLGLGKDKTAGVLSPESEKRIKSVSSTAGVFAGAIAGMVPLLFGVSFGKSASGDDDLWKAAQLSLFGEEPPQKKPAALERKQASGRAGGPYIGPRGGKWADPQHTIPWHEGGGERPTQARGKNPQTASAEVSARPDIKVRYWKKKGWESTIIVDQKKLDGEWSSKDGHVVRSDIPEHQKDPQVPASDINTLSIGDELDDGIVAGIRLYHSKRTGRVLEYLVKPKPAAKRKEGPSSAQQAVIDLAAKYGIPVEAHGPRSIAIGGPAAFDRDLGKWNGERGSAGRRIANAAAVKAWLEKHGEAASEKQERKSEFKDEMDRRRNQGHVLRGNTFAFREQIKAAGGVWDRLEKCWLMPDAESKHRIERAIIENQSRQRAAPSAPRTDVEERTASERQVGYAWQLINRLRQEDYGTFTTYGYQGLSLEGLKKKSANDVSAIIDHLRDELFT